jgi:hypothetical protein
MISTETANNKYDQNHHYYEFLIALSTTEGIITLRENIHHHDDLVDVIASSDQSYRRAIDEITALCEKWLIEDGAVDQYSIIAINDDLCWKERLELPCRS